MNKTLNSSAIADVFWARGGKRSVGAPCVRVAIPPSMRVVVVGEGDALGDWCPANGVELECAGLPLWCWPQSMADVEQGSQFKFVVMEGQSVVAWESGENRVWAQRGDCGEFRGAPYFAPRFAGVAIPVFSIRAKGCEGIGDYCSMADFALWAAACGMRVVQTLPINDTTISHTRCDSYPYKSISVFALHPLYIRVSEVDESVDVSELIGLDGNAEVDYEKVDEIKWRLFGQIYGRIGQKTLQSDSFAQFFNHNKHWLKPYAVFCYLRDKFSTADFEQWPSPYNRYSPEVETAVAEQYAEQVGLYYFLQFHADKQLRAARDTARAAGVVFKGDIAIGVCRQSVDVWTKPHLFNLDGQAGAPPDEFSVDGQNWGFPTYNWQKMAEDGYDWWRKRFEKMADYFDMYRIDHILGFFRIWQIPVSQPSGLMGHFVPSLPFSAQELADWGLPMYEERYIGVDDTDTNTLFVRDHTYRDMYHPRIAAQQTPRYQNTLDAYEKERFNALYTHYFYSRHNDFWAGQALAKLPALINATNMLCCAEDLGMIPDCVGWTLRELQVTTLEVQRMPKNSAQMFAIPAHYPYMSVATTSTHDISPLRLWWREDRDKIQRYYNEVMWWDGEAPDEASPEICENIVNQHLNSPSMAVILPFQDWLSVDAQLRAQDPASERINIPSNPNQYWRYRMHIGAQELIENGDFNLRLAQMIEQSMLSI